MIEFLRRVWSTVGGKISVVVAVSIFVVAVVGVVYGVAVRPGDRGLIERGGIELSWDRSDLPVICLHVPELPAVYLAAYWRVRKRLTVVVGVELVGPCVSWELPLKPSEAPDGTILLTVRDRSGTEHGAESGYRYDERDGRILSVLVALDRYLPDELIDLIVLHEVGHALGLDHDREASSVMYPVARGRRKDLSSRDVEILKTVYVR